ncbi:Zinc knuckle CX2CX4HX4C [Penicillium taxi]|uniref:Zinc knuckle CX2CX4HX4C n=1 Tax=Penicillium taxi TaxID=168475 RepID=UPI0025453A4A|nr:Zinc knuckle CX2CX4HX4C [Penicillium taxi]KAJ5898953.1 Zinc knuckle CX2CX4HX4C [Penicillium taxi]
MGSFDGESRSHDGSYQESHEGGRDEGYGYDEDYGYDKGHEDCYKDYNASGEFSNVCFNCGKEGHSKQGCINERVFAGTCFNCGLEGHPKQECPNERVFTGTCFNCGLEGHLKQNCPTKGPDLCRNCEEEGHAAHECTNKRKLNLDDVEDMNPEVAWAMMKAASAPGKDRDIDDFRKAFGSFSKANPDITYLEIEMLFRAERFPVYLIAMQKEHEPVITLIDLQGNIDRKYMVGFHFSADAPKKSMRERWPESPEENMERLANCGLPFDRRAMKCHKCEGVGHIAKNCTEEVVSTHERVEIKCFNCSEVGHRVRDCPEERVRKNPGCRNCGSDEHRANNCTEERSAVHVECRRCKETGHFAKDCPRYADMPDGCRNCESPDHKSRDCPLPRDYSKVKCNRCQMMGHTVVRCRLPDPEAEPVCEKRPDTPVPYSSDSADHSASGEDELW